MLNWMFSAVGRLLVWLTRQLARLIAWVIVRVVTHPRTTTAAGATVSAVTYFGWQLCAAVAAGVFVSLSTWKAAHPVSFGATVGTWARTWWNKWWIYRRDWREVFAKCDLTVQAGGEVVFPKLHAIRCTPWWDHVTVAMPVGQSPKRYRHEETADALRLAFKAERMTVKTLKPRLLELSFMRRDPLLATIPATPIPAGVEQVDFRRVPVGIDEFGQPYTVSLLGGCTSGAGTMGAGKAGLEWNVLRAIAPAIAAGLVRPVGIDPKLKELSQALPLFAPGDYVGLNTPDLPQAVIDLLTRLVEEMGEANNADGAAGERDFTPRPGRPLTLILIDEMAPLLKYWPRRTRDKIEELLGILLTQGRAAGFIVIALIQEPTKDVFTLRDLFARRIALRVPTPQHTEAALIDNAVDYGAGCHEIPESLPGMLFSLQEGARSTVRARLGYVRNEDIHELVAYIETARKVVDLSSRAGGTGATDVAA